MQDAPEYEIDNMKNLPPRHRVKRIDGRWDTEAGAIFEGEFTVISWERGNPTVQVQAIPYFVKRNLNDPAGERAPEDMWLIALVFVWSGTHGQEWLWDTVLLKKGTIGSGHDAYLRPLLRKHLINYSR